MSLPPSLSQPPTLSDIPRCQFEEARRRVFDRRRTLLTISDSAAALRCAQDFIRDRVRFFSFPSHVHAHLAQRDLISLRGTCGLPFVVDPALQRLDGDVHRALIPFATHDWIGFDRVPAFLGHTIVDLVRSLPPGITLGDALPDRFPARSRALDSVGLGWRASEPER